MSDAWVAGGTRTPARSRSTPWSRSAHTCSHSAKLSWQPADHAFEQVAVVAPVERGDRVLPASATVQLASATSQLRMRLTS